MVTKKSKCLLFIIGIILANTAVSQTDTSKLNYSEESSDSSDYKYRRVYQYLDINMKDENRLLKFSPGFDLSSDMNFFQFLINHEWKIKQQYSVLISNFMYYRTIDYQYYNSNLNIFQNETLTNYQSSLGLAFRYYFTMKKRMENRISGNNLNGMYTQLGCSFLSFQRRNKDASDFVTLHHQPYGVFFEFKPSASVGIQRRLNNWSYYDIYTNISWAYGSLNSNLGFRIGFAWGNKK